MCNNIDFLNFNFFTDMETSFLITAKNETSEFLLNFVDVQEYMNNLEKLGIVKNVLVRKFENMVMTKEILYNYNGESWEKII